MLYTEKNVDTTKNSSVSTRTTHETGFQPYLQETESQLMEEVEKLFQLGGIAMPAKVFSELLSTLAEHLGKDANDSVYELSYVKECVSDSTFILERLCAMYDLHKKREYYLRVFAGEIIGRI